MKKVLKVQAFKCVAEFVEQGDYQKANEIMKIINRSINKDKKNNIFTETIQLNSKKEEKYFKDNSYFIPTDKEQEN